MSRHSCTCLLASEPDIDTDGSIGGREALELLLVKRNFWKYLLFMSPGGLAFIWSPLKQPQTTIQMGPQSE